MVIRAGSVWRGGEGWCLWCSVVAAASSRKMFGATVHSADLNSTAVHQSIMTCRPFRSGIGYKSLTKRFV